MRIKQTAAEVRRRERTCRGSRKTPVAGVGRDRQVVTRAWRTSCTRAPAARGEASESTPATLQLHDRNTHALSRRLGSIFFPYFVFFFCLFVLPEDERSRIPPGSTGPVSSRWERPVPGALDLGGNDRARPSNRSAGALQRPRPARPYPGRAPQPPGPASAISAN